MSNEELAIELAKPASEFSYIKIKNSWGIKAEFNESGVPVVGSTDGYYIIDAEYLKHSLIEGTRLSILTR